MERAREEKKRKEAAAKARASGPVLRRELRRMPAADQVRCRAIPLGVHSFVVEALDTSMPLPTQVHGGIVDSNEERGWDTWRQRRQAWDQSLLRNCWSVSSRLWSMKLHVLDSKM